MSSAIERLSYLVQTLNNSAVELAEQEDLVSMEERLQQKFNALRLISQGHEVKDISQINVDDIVQTKEFEKLLSKIDKLTMLRNFVLLHPSESIPDGVLKLLPEEMHAKILSEIDERVKKRWHIMYRFDELLNKDYDQLLLVLDSLRQQLSQGVGFRCPLLEPWSDECLCNPQFKASLMNFCRWAITEKRLGAGEWSALPFPCSGTG